MKPSPLSLFQKAEPSSCLRGVHLDLKGLPPPFPRLMEWVRLFATLRFTALLVEWEDTFPWMFDARLRGPSCYTAEEVRQFAAACAEHGMEIIPLVQCLAHAENVLSKPGYEALREVSHRTDVFHPLHPDSSGIVCAMINDVLSLLTETRRFHIGGDEADTFGNHPESQAYIAAHGKEKLYLRQLWPVIESLRARSIRPLLWHDEFVSWPKEELAHLAVHIDLVVWGYTGDPRDPETYHYRLPHAELLHAAGCPLWAASAYKGAGGANSNRPNPAQLQKATCGWMDLNPRFLWKGVIATGWSRYASGRIQTEPMDAALDSLVNTAVILHDGAPPPGGLATCEAWLDQHGEGDGFRRCKAAMERLTRHTDKAWEYLRHLEEQGANLDAEPDRAHSGIEEVLLGALQSEVAAIDEAAVEVEASLYGRVAEPWGARYHRVKSEPIKAALRRLQSRLSSREAHSSHSASLVNAV